MEDWAKGVTGSEQSGSNQPTGQRATLATVGSPRGTALLSEWAVGCAMANGRCPPLHRQAWSEVRPLRGCEDQSGWQRPSRHRESRIGRGYLHCYSPPYSAALATHPLWRAAVCREGDRRAYIAIVAPTVYVAGAGVCAPAVLFKRQVS